MGYFSQLAITIDEKKWSQVNRKPTDEKREILEYYLEHLQNKLSSLDEIRPHNYLSPMYDRYFYSTGKRHYNEDPDTVQDILAAISEVKDLLWDLDCYERSTEFERRKAGEEAALNSAADNQVLMVSFWDYAFLFHEAAAYKKALRVVVQG